MTRDAEIRKGEKKSSVAHAPADGSQAMSTCTGLFGQALISSAIPVYSSVYSNTVNF